MKILGIVVLYHPDEHVAAHIGTYIGHIDKLMVWDNTPGASADLSGILAYDNLIVRGEEINRGIGYALNQGVRHAIENGYTHLLTMDQDSYFSPGDFENYLSVINEYGTDKEVIFSTNYLIQSQQVTYYPVDEPVREVSSCMTSGSIYPVSLFSKLGYFRDELFVWGIDSEFSWRAKRKNYPTLCFTSVLLIHNLGNQRKRRNLLGKEVFPNEYAPARTYYNVRNGIILHKEYPDYVNLQSHLKYHLYKRMVFVLLFEQDKIRKFKALFYGYLHGKKNLSGECPISF